MGLNWKIIREELSGVIEDSLAELVEGAEEDLKSYGVEIANSLIIAMRTGRADLRRELQDQFVMLAEIHRIRLNTAAKDVLDNIINIGMRLGRAALGV